MSVSEKLIKSVENAMEHETLTPQFHSLVAVLIDAYRAQVAAALRLEETIHRIRKD